MRILKNSAQILPVPGAPNPGARVWVCGYCGLKLFFGRESFRPELKCLCGYRQWQPWRREGER